MSGATWIRGSALRVTRARATQANGSERERGERDEERRDPARHERQSSSHSTCVLPASRSSASVVLDVEPRVRGFDRQEEPIVRRTPEPLAAERRVVEAAAGC